MIDLSSLLKLLPVVGPVVAAAPEFKKIYDQMVGTFNQRDQQVLRDAYDDLVADNDEGHRRLQQKLSEAARR